MPQPFHLQRIVQVTSICKTAACVYFVCTQEEDRICGKFYVALALHEIIKEVPTTDVAIKYFCYEDSKNLDPKKRAEDINRMENELKRLQVRV
jgi:hypothetical protein